MVVFFLFQQGNIEQALKLTNEFLTLGKLLIWFWGNYDVIGIFGGEFCWVLLNVSNKILDIDHNSRYKKN